MLSGDPGWRTAYLNRRQGHLSETAMKILVCDRCGLAITDREDISLALEGQEAWQDAVRGRGEEPRGVFPCMNYIRCHGEMKPIDSRIYWLRKRIMKLRRGEK